MSIWYVTQPLGGKKSWPSGADGPLVINFGEVVTLPPGSVKDYSSISIATGGTLQIGVGSAWTIIGCSGNCDITGDIIAQNGQHTGGTFNATAPDGLSLSYVIVQSAGGAGGAGNGAGGAAASGNGGGGGGFGAGSAASAGSGGNGGAGQGSTSAGTAGSGGAVYSNFGTSGGSSATNTELVQVGTNEDTGHFLQENGFLYGAGSNVYGGIGDNTLVDKSSPVSVVGGRSYVYISRGSEANHVMALQHRTGQLWAWGADTMFGQLGVGSNNFNYSSPVSVAFGRSWVQVAANRWNSAGIDGYDYSVWTWGSNLYGQLGDGTGTHNSLPVAVLGAGLGGRSYQYVSLGVDHTALLSTDGTAWATGRNHVGQLGDNTGTGRSSPVSVVGGRSFTRIAAGSRHTLAINGSDGSIWGWGENIGTELGTNNATNRSSPVSVVGTRSYREISAGKHWSVALDGSGFAWAWGDNLYGQLGINTAAVTLQSNNTGAGATTLTSTVTKVAQPFTVSGTKLIPNVQVGIKRNGFPTGDFTYKIIKEFAQNEIQHLAFSAVPLAGNFQLTYNAQNTTTIPFNATNSTVQSALEGLSNLDPGDISVTGNFTSGFDITFTGPHANTNENQITVFSNTLTLNDGVNEQQLVSFTGTGTSGSYKLNYNGTDSSAIQFNDNNTAVQTALNTIPGIVVSVAGNTGTGFTVTFTTPAKTNVNQLTVTNNTTDFTSISVSTPVQGAADTPVTITPSTTQQGQSPIPSSNPADIMWSSVDVFASATPNGDPYYTTTAVLTEDTPYVTLTAGNYYLTVEAQTSYTSFWSSGNDIMVQQGAAGLGNALSWNGSTWSSVGAPLWHNIWDANSAMRSSPVSVLGGRTFIQIAASKRAVLAVDTTGAVWAWGYNGSGKLGTNTVSHASSPVAVARLLSITGMNVYGAGGGGGSRGAHGQGVYLRVQGNITGAGNFNASGLNGANGGNGGQASDPYAIWAEKGGGGGGGGAGGSGGKVVIRYHGTISAVNATAGPGTAGFGGTGGKNVHGVGTSQDESQSLAFSQVPTSGAFTLAHNGNQTTSLNWNATTTDIQNALNALPSLSGGVTVTGNFTGQAEIHRITFSGTPTTGSFRIVILGKESPLIPFNATNTTVQTTLNNMQALSGTGVSVSVTGSFATGFQITYSPFNTYQAIFISNNTLFNGATPVTATPSVFQFGFAGFTIAFGTTDGGTDQPQLTVPTNTLLATATPVTITVRTYTQGQPATFAGLGGNGVAGTIGGTGTVDIASI